MIDQPCLLQPQGGRRWTVGLPSPARDPTTSRFPGVWPAQFLHLSEGQLLLDVANTCFLSALYVEEASGPIGVTWHCFGAHMSTGRVAACMGLKSVVSV